MTVAQQEEDRYHVVASSSLTAAGTRVLKHGETFAVVNRFGDVHPAGAGEQGIYHRGTKFVSRLQLRLSEQRPLVLSSSMLENNLVLAVDLTNPDLYDGEHLAVPYGTVHVSRSIFLTEGICFQRLQLSNFGAATVALDLAIEFGSDFADVFEVRGTRRPRRGEVVAPESSDTGVVLSYRGLDRRLYKTRFEFAPAPERVGAEEAMFRVTLGGKQTKEIYVWIACDDERRDGARLPAYETALAAATRHAHEREQQDALIVTSNLQFNDWVARSRDDVEMLVTETPHGPYPYAGVPWFSTPFGRDGIWTAIEMLWVAPEYAAGVLRFLSASQSRESDPDLDAEPGKIVHEMRDGEMAFLREIPFGRYYGSIDSTPLYLMLAERYYRATADRELIAELWPNLLLAVEWLDRHGDVDGDGFLEYGRRSKDGLLQQGWKDSNDSVFHRDGTLAVGPIALCEVQGYAYAARNGMATLARVMGDDERAERFEQQARTLRERFDQAFWCQDLSTYALALDGKKLPCRVKTSNAAHCLYTGIALPERAGALARQLLSEQMFSGWGIRTLASDEERYNPMSYHNGSIWPHDNAIAAEGLSAYGYRQQAARVLQGLFDASGFVDLHRLPELFCGFTRKLGQGPTLYPVACSPQAWAAGAVFLMLKAALGMDINASARRVTFHAPSLPEFLDQVRISRLRIGDARVDIQLQRYSGDVGITVLEKSGTVEIATLK